jgi:hypothetical protein
VRWRPNNGSVTVARHARELGGAMARDVSNVEAAIVELSSGAASFGEGKGAEEKNKRG